MFDHGKGECVLNEKRSSSNRCIERKPKQKIVHRLRKLLDKVIPHSPGVGIESETGGGKSSARRQAEHRLSDRNNYDQFENHLCTGISEQLEHLFMSHGSSDVNSQLLVPSDLSLRIAEDVLRMSQNEPCGIRGCELFIDLQEKSTCRKIGVIDCDPTTVATFELYLTVKVDRRPSAIVKSMLASFKDRVVHGSSNLRKVLRPDYQLTKRKLYRPN